MLIIYSNYFLHMCVNVGERERQGTEVVKVDVYNAWAQPSKAMDSVQEEGAGRVERVEMSVRADL